MEEIIHFVAWIGKNKGDKAAEVITGYLAEYVGGRKQLDKILTEFELGL